ncbi:hypothetical protein I316_01781 [Kwoniella heveanensis BCC8398]|uniref:Uncharacterized protein n=1 Tax=Kwoniella heveanensis BCC8398 TaxID=1296120 RepID=A0A1B9GZS8_9TREE|nr:hypothetical protein I316_01781 [Kwoniella heveanensis BCC8398]
MPERDRSQDDPMHVRDGNGDGDEVNADDIDIGTETEPCLRLLSGLGFDQYRIGEERIDRDTGTRQTNSSYDEDRRGEEDEEEQEDKDEDEPMDIDRDLYADEWPVSEYTIDGKEDPFFAFAENDTDSNSDGGGQKERYNQRRHTRKTFSTPLM